jgi:hypothetical protein
MADDNGGGYTGVVYSAEAAPYTGADGYTGVVYSEVGSGFTGQAPVTAENAPAGDATDLTRPGAGAEVSPLRVTPSPYDQALVSRGGAPGSQTATNYAPPPGPPSADELESMADQFADDQPDPGTPDDPAPEPAPPPPELNDGPVTPEGTDTRTDLLNQLANDYLDLRRQIQLSPDPEPNRAAEMAQRLLQTRQPPPPAGPPTAHDLTGPLAEWMQNQVAQAIASSKPSSLGAAYMQGILQEAVSTIIAQGASAADMQLDPVGTSIQSAQQIIESIGDHMSQGEGFWEAVNSVLNPMVRVFNNAYDANEIAGRAMGAFRAGHWDEAVRLARESGRRAVRSGAAAAETVMLATGAAEGATKITRRWRQRPPTEMPPPTPRPRLPEPEPFPQPKERTLPPVEVPPRSEVDPIPASSQPRADGLTGTVYHPDGVPPPPAPLPSTTHSHFTQIPVSNRGFLRTKLDLLQRLYKEVQQPELARQMESLPKDQRLDPRKRNWRATAAINTKEQITVTQNQLAHPDRAYVYHARLDIVTDKGQIIPGRAIAGKGRIPDTFEGFPDGTYNLPEYKTERTIVNAYPEGPNVTVQNFAPGTKLGDQLARQRKIIDYAKSKNYQLRVRGQALDGRPVEIVVPPADYRGDVVTTYGEIPN